MKTLKVGMPVLVKGLKDQEFPIKEIKDGKARIEGQFTNYSEFPCQSIWIEADALLYGNSKLFSMKDCPQTGELLLVSNDNDTWKMRAFYEFSEDALPLTIIEANDVESFDEDDDPCIEWKFYKRFTEI